MDLPQFESYGRYSSQNYGAHCLRFIDAGGNSFWFSYSTLVAFSKPGHPRVVHENDWGPTTGKHLNWIDSGNKKARLGATQFRTTLDAQFGE